MDKDTLRNIIVDMRNKGMTFDAISDRLRSDYGVIKSRQAVHGMYIRAVNSKLEKPIDICRTDIINYKVIGLSIMEIADKTGYSYNKVREILIEENSKISTIEENKVRLVKRLILEGNSANAISSIIKYKDTHAKASVFSRWIEVATNEIVDDTIRKKKAEIKNVLNGIND